MGSNAEINGVEHVWHDTIQPKANGMPQQCWYGETVRQKVRSIGLIRPHGCAPRRVMKTIRIR